MTFEAGQSGNPGGRPKTKPWRDALERALNKIDTKKKRPRLDLVADACVTAALAGDGAAIKEIGARMDGLAVATINNTHTFPLLEQDIPEPDEAKQ